MFKKLKSIHDDLLAAIAEMESLVGGGEPELTRLAGVRWRISRASGRRLTMLEADVYPHLLSQIAPADAERLAALRAEGRAQRAVSAEHVGKWTIANVMADWAGYCRAAAAMTKVMRARVASEQAVIYPLFDKADGGRGV